MPQATSVGSLPGSNLLYDRRAVHFGTAHYQVVLQHWTQPGQAVAARQGRGVRGRLGQCPRPAPTHL